MSMSGVSTQDLIKVANKCADAARTIIKQYFRQPIPIETKLDQSPVTIADRTAEEIMRTIIKQEFPDHGIKGEEFGFEQPKNNSEFTWVLDPIDGTKAFITGKPTFGTLIAVVQNKKPIIGIIDQAISDERWVGIDTETNSNSKNLNSGQNSSSSSLQTTLNGKIVKARKCENLGQSYLQATSPHMFQIDGDDDLFFKKFEEVRKNVKVPLYGCDCYAYGLLAAGFCDLVIEASMEQYDYLALVPVVKGAGGVITDWKGAEFQLVEEGYYFPGEVLAAGDERVHQEALEILKLQ